MAKEGTRARHEELVGLAAIAASTILVEITLTKFLAYKVQHHATYAVISMVVLSLGAAGLYVFWKPPSWTGVSRAAALYGSGIGLVTLVFCWVPIDPQNPDIARWLAGAAVPLYLLLFAAPLFLAGVCISRVLSHGAHPVATVYFWDLLAAALAALVCPLLLRGLGGYGTMAAAGALAMVAAVAFGRLDGRPARSYLAEGIAFALTAAALFAYPGWAVARWGFDVRSFKDLTHRRVFQDDFGGIAETYWNGVARIDVSRTASSDSPMYRFGLPASSYLLDIPGRYVLVDGGANTRQFVANGNLAEQHYLGGALWASPYVAHGHARRALVIGGGGGIDILVAKYFSTRVVDVVELNPATVGLLTGTLDDPDGHLYTPWLGSDATSKVRIAHREGRHFCTVRPTDHYDIIQASGVDTLTAITTGGNSLVESYLYTREAVEQYLRILAPGGVLSLTHWRASPPTLGLRMFLTYFEALERAGVAEPHRHLMVLGDAIWVDLLLKKTPFEPAEVERARRWAARQGHSLVFDPERSLADTTAEGTLWPLEAIFTAMALATPEQRARLVEAYPARITPVTDDSPYFYRVEKNGSRLALAFPDVTIRWLFLLACAAAIALTVVPLRRLRRRGVTRGMLEHAAFFALSGFAFLLFEAAIIQLLSVFVGGPTYSLAVVLVCVLGGYAIGSRLSLRVRPTSRTFLAFGGALAALFVAILLGLPALTRAALPLPFNARIALAAAVTLIPSIAVGIPVPLAMGRLRGQQGDVVAWMWGISSAFNVLGGMSFVPLTQLWGISGAMGAVAALYAVANAGLAWVIGRDSNSTARS
jgi:spermidine synthase